MRKDVNDIFNSIPLYNVKSMYLESDYMISMSFTMYYGEPLKNCDNRSMRFNHIINETPSAINSLFGISAVAYGQWATNATVYTTQAGIYNITGKVTGSVGI